MAESKGCMGSYEYVTYEQGQRLKNSDILGVAPRAAHLTLPLSAPLTCAVWVTLGSALRNGSA